MHIVLGALALLVTLLILLKRLADAGIDLGGLNPFLRRRRREWRGKFDANPLFLISDPKEIAAVLALVLYFYSRWLARLEARFRLVHPRKFRMTTLLMFYGCSAAAFLLVVLAPWLASGWGNSPLGAATGYFMAPALVASAAGFIFPTQQGKTSG